jgi:hypothetical protein
MDCCHDREWKFVSSILTWSIYCYENFLPSIEYRKISKWSCQFHFATLWKICRSSSLVSIEIVHTIYVSFIYCRERKAHPQWSFIPHESYRLTEQDITDFVNCVKEYAFISIFNKNYMKEAATICQYISMLRPELIVPPIVEKFDLFCFS